MAARVVIQDGAGRCELPCEVVMTIGRDKNSTIVLADKLASRNHGMIRQLGDGDYYLIDVGSSNGSYLNGRRITVPALLKDGDEIRIGDSVLQFEQDTAGDRDRVDDEGDRTTLATSSDIKQITILVADIRGYTTLSEQVPIAALTKLMATWFRAVGERIERNEGMIDKFIGDCVYARWYTEASLTSTIVKTLRAALDLHTVSERVSREFPDLPTPIRIGVGINTGQAAVGVARDNTAIGDAVNLAFRLESASKSLGKDVVLSRLSYHSLPQNCWTGRETSVDIKGKREPVDVLPLTFDELAAVLAGLEEEVSAG